MTFEYVLEVLFWTTKQFHLPSSCMSLARLVKLHVECKYSMQILRANGFTLWHWHLPSRSKGIESLAVFRVQLFLLPWKICHALWFDAYVESIAKFVSCVIRCSYSSANLKWTPNFGSSNCRHSVCQAAQRREDAFAEFTCQLPQFWLNSNAKARRLIILVARLLLLRFAKGQCDVLSVQQQLCFRFGSAPTFP